MAESALYARVSSRSQSVKTQVDACRQAAAARGDQIARVFVESRTGANLDRPALAELRAAIHAGAVRKLYVFRLDRLTRSGIRDTLGLLEEFRGAGCAVVSVADGFALDGPAGDVIAAVMAWAAQMERQALGERIAAARARVEAAGGAWGRPARAGAELVAKVRKAASVGKSQRAIAVALKVPRSTVRRILGQKGAYAAVRGSRTKSGLG